MAARSLLECHRMHLSGRAFRRNKHSQLEAPLSNQQPRQSTFLRAIVCTESPIARTGMKTGAQVAAFTNTMGPVTQSWHSKLLVAQPATALKSDAVDAPGHENAAERRGWNSASTTTPIARHAEMEPMGTQRQMPTASSMALPYREMYQQHEPLARQGVPQSQ